MGRDGLIKRLKHFCHSFFRYYSASTRAFTFNLSLPAFHLSSGRGASYWRERPSNTQSSSKASREWSGTVIFPGRSRFNPWPRLELNGASSVTESRFPGWKRGGGGTIQGGNERPNRPTFPRTNQLCFPSSLLPLKNPLPVQNTIAERRTRFYSYSSVEAREKDFFISLLEQSIKRMWWSSRSFEISTKRGRIYDVTSLSLHRFRSREKLSLGGRSASFSSQAPSVRFDHASFRGYCVCVRVTSTSRIERSLENRGWRSDPLPLSLFRRTTQRVFWLTVRNRSEKNNFSPSSVQTVWKAEEDYSIAW